MDKAKEYVLCAAIWFKDFPKAVHSPLNIDKGIVLCGHRHGHIIGQLVSMTGKRMGEAGEYEEGFITNKNNFLDRKQARELFVSCGGEPEFEELYSEDLY